jgi:hypothetical protein
LASSVGQYLHHRLGIGRAFQTIKADLAAIFAVVPLDEDDKKLLNNALLGVKQLAVFKPPPKTVWSVDSALEQVK